MRYLCLIYQDESLWETMPKTEADGIDNDYFAFTDAITKSGQYISGNPLQPTRTATTVRVRNGRISISDGPFMETREQLGGYFLVEARDLDDALRLASGIPGVRRGSVEVRPIMEVGEPRAANDPR